MPTENYIKTRKYLKINYNKYIWKRVAGGGGGKKLDKKAIKKY
jgi:hypothetical protein